MVTTDHGTHPIPSRPEAQGFERDLKVDGGQAQQAECGMPHTTSENFAARPHSEPGEFIFGIAVSKPSAVTMPNCVPCSASPGARDDAGESATVALRNAAFPK